MLPSTNKVFNMSEKSLLEYQNKSPQPPTNISKNYLIYNNIKVSHGEDVQTNYRSKLPSGESFHCSHCCTNKNSESETLIGPHDQSLCSCHKQSCIERILWILTFGVCLTVAAYMINEVWAQYYDNPVIVTFNPSEEEISSIPFPAVTVCNMNPFSKLRVEEFEKRFREASTPEERNQSLEALRMIYGLCSAQQSFIKNRGYAKQRGFIMIPEAAAEASSAMDKQLNDFLLDNSQSCAQMLRLCEWESQEFECETLFRPILTDYGMCCTFNALPQQRMLKENKIKGIIDKSYVCTRRGLHDSVRNRENPFWNDSEVLEWRKWKYQSNLVIKETQKYPFRQQRAGMMNGLSILIDPDIENSFCPSSDSEGIKILLHAPIEVPRVADLGSIVGLNREAFVRVTPDVTISDPGILDYDHRTRNCYFGKEFKLKFYKPYTKANCQEECWNEILLRRCKCVMYHTPRHEFTEVCGSSPTSADFKCVRELENKMYNLMDKECSHCIYSCNNLGYTTEVTSATLQSSEILWTVDNSTSAEKNSSTAEWMQHRISIVHIYMGSDTVVPKLRRKLYNTIDLIANTGGLLGLSLGFSILSAVEVCYIFIIGFCKKCFRHGSRYYKNKYNSPQESSINKLATNSSSRRLLNSSKVEMLKPNGEERNRKVGQLWKCFDA